MMIGIDRQKSNNYGFSKVHKTPFFLWLKRRWLETDTICSRVNAYENRICNGFALLDVLLALLAVCLSASVLLSTLQAFQRGDAVHVEEKLETKWYAP